MKERFPKHVYSVAEALGYYQNRARQFLYLGWSWDGAHRVLEDWGLEVTFCGPDGAAYQSVYIFEPHTGKGHLSRYLKSRTDEQRFFTSDYCPEMFRFLIRHGYLFTCISRGSVAYDMISNHYGEQKAQRSGQFYMNHIDEGLDILSKLGAHTDVQSAFCLHPILQMDDDFTQVLGEANPLPHITTRAVLLAMEYRSWANAHLPKHPPAKPQFGPSFEVKLMLIADKMQNRKDYELYSRAKCSPSHAARLDDYFREWFDTFYLTVPFFQDWVSSINERTGWRYPQR